MGKIIAIGGGEIGRPGKPIETLEIDKEIIRLTGKKNPQLLFIPTASSDSEGYVSTVREHFSGRLACNIDLLLLMTENYSHEELREKILSTDIIYVGGGNTQQMINIWKEKGVDIILKEAYAKGIVMSGLSAGAVCWFEAACSDSESFNKTDEGWKYIVVNGLGLVPMMLCPHYDVEEGRAEGFKQNLKNQSLTGLALDNSTAIEIIDDKYRIIISSEGKKAHKIKWIGDEYIIEEVEIKDEFTDLSLLVN